MAVNPVGGGYLNSAPLRASCEPVYAFAWDQATRTKLFPLRLILPAGRLSLWNSVHGTRTYFARHKIFGLCNSAMQISRWNRGKSSEDGIVQLLTVNLEITRSAFGSWYLATLWKVPHTFLLYLLQRYFLGRRLHWSFIREPASSRVWRRAILQRHANIQYSEVGCETRLILSSYNVASYFAVCIVDLEDDEDIFLHRSRDY